MCRLCFDGFDSVVRPLLEAGFPVNDFCYIVDNGSVVREPQLRLCTLLQASILSGTSPVVRLLLKNGADPDKTVGVLFSRSVAQLISFYLIQSSFGDEAHDIRMDTTLPLIYAIMSSRLEIVPQLLDCGADVYKVIPSCPSAAFLILSLLIDSKFVHQNFCQKCDVYSNVGFFI